MVLEVLFKRGASRHDGREFCVVHCTAAGVGGKILFQNLFCDPAHAGGEASESCSFNGLMNSISCSFNGLMNSINWPASSVWVFIAQLGEHCSASAEATGSNPVEAPKIFFSGYFRNCLNCDSLRWSHTHFICIPAVHIISFSVSFLSRVDELNKLASLQCMGLHSSAGRALQR